MNLLIQSKQNPKQCADVNGEEEKRELKYNPKYLLGAKLLSEQQHPPPFQILQVKNCHSKTTQKMLLPLARQVQHDDQ